MKHISTISSLLLLGTTVGLLMRNWTSNHRDMPDSAETGYQLYL